MLKKLNKIMKKLYFKIKASIILLILVLTSCAKREADFIENKNNLPKNNTSSRQYSSDNYLHFVSLEQYDSILDVLSALDNNDPKNFMLNFDDGFKSM